MRLLLEVSHCPFGVKAVKDDPLGIMHHGCGKHGALIFIRLFIWRHLSKL